MRKRGNASRVSQLSPDSSWKKRERGESERREGDLLGRGFRRKNESR